MGERILDSAPFSSWSIKEEELDPKVKRRILVVGAKGMLGRDLMRVLLASPEEEVIGWDLEELDIQKKEDTLPKIEKLQPHLLIHLAAYTDVDACESDQEKAFSVNAEGTKHLALAALKCGAKMVYLSTDYVFDGNKKEPYLETDTPHPLNVYGHSKWRGEQYVQELMKDFLIIRTQWLYGQYGKNFVNSILQQAQQKRILSIVNDQIGSPTFTVDLAEAIHRLIQYDVCGIFHVANSDLCTWYTFGQAILKLSGMNQVKVIPISSKEFGRPAVRPSYSVLNCQKFRKVTGWALRPWSEALKEYLSTLRLRLGVEGERK